MGIYRSSFRLDTSRESEELGPRYPESTFRVSFGLATFDQIIRRQLLAVSEHDAVSFE